MTRLLLFVDLMHRTVVRGLMLVTLASGVFFFYGIRNVRVAAQTHRKALKEKQAANAPASPEVGATSAPAVPAPASNS